MTGSNPRWRTRRGASALALAALIVVACARHDHPRDDGAAAGMVRVERPAYGVTVRYPARLQAAQTFEADYFLGTRWNLDAPDGVPGKPLLALTLAQSNRITRAVLRLGASDDPRALASCDAPANGRRLDSDAPGHVVIGGVRFSRTDLGDAAMNHYLRRHRYRAVHAGHCIAIDLIVTGTRGDVYDPPREPPFAMDAGFARLTALLDGITFKP